VNFLEWLSRWFRRQETPPLVPQGQFGLSRRGLEFIKSWEGYRAEVYADTGGVLTIGYGHVLRKGETFGRLGERQAESLLVLDLVAHELRVNQYVFVPLSQNKFDALVSFDYNTGAIATSTLTRKLNAGDYFGAEEEFMRWNRVGTLEVPGLTRRRKAERDMFGASVYRGSDGRMV